MARLPYGFIYCLLPAFFHSIHFYAQEKLEIEGAIILQNAEGNRPEAGTIRFNPENHDFEGWNGFHWMSLTRLQEMGAGVTDIEGNFYRTVILGNQEWMMENLDCGKYNDGIAIPNIQSDLDWSNLDSGGWCYFDNSLVHANNYGKLYNWFAVETGKLCPIGWHVPSQEDWDQLEVYLGGAEIAGAKMKEIGNALWIAGENASNTSAFSARPGGLRYVEGTFDALGVVAIWWSQYFDSLYPWAEILSDAGSGADYQPFNKQIGLSVRCLKN